MILHNIKFCTQYFVLLPQNVKLTENYLQLRTVPLSLQLKINGGDISPRGTVSIICCCPNNQFFMDNQVINEKLAFMPSHNKFNLPNWIDCRVQDTSSLVLTLNPADDLLWD